MVYEEFEIEIEKTPITRMKTPFPKRGLCLMCGLCGLIQQGTLQVVS